MSPGSAWVSVITHTRPGISLGLCFLFCKIIGFSLTPHITGLSWESNEITDVDVL